MQVILGTKIGMTQIIGEDGVVTPVTILQAGPCTVTQIKTVDTDGYNAVQVGYGQGKNLSKSVAGHVKKAGEKVSPKVLKEFRVDEMPEGMKLGDSLTVESFKIGDKVAVTGTSKGKGFASFVICSTNALPCIHIFERLLDRNYYFYGAFNCALRQKVVCRYDARRFCSAFCCSANCNRQAFERWKYNRYFNRIPRIYLAGNIPYA